MGQKYEEAEETLCHCILQDSDSLNSFSLKADLSNEETFQTKDFRQGMALAPSPQPTVLDRLKERLVVALKKNQEKQVFRTRAKLSQVHQLFSGAQDGRPATTCLFSIKKTSVSVRLQVVRVLVKAFFSLLGFMKTKP